MLTFRKYILLVTMLLPLNALSTLPKEDVFRLGLSQFKAKEHDVAFVNLKESALAGHPRAQFYLGQLYENGWGVEPSLFFARNSYTAAMCNGHKKAREALDRVVKMILDDEKKEALTTVAPDINRQSLLSGYYSKQKND